jgi:hypothetical protein
VDIILIPSAAVRKMADIKKIEKMADIKKKLKNGRYKKIASMLRSAALKVISELHGGCV